MKVVSAKKMADLEALAYKQGYTDQAFMEQAGKGIAEAVQSFIKDLDLPKKILLLCGKGNNAGDTFVAGCYLIDQGYQVDAIQLNPLDQSSLLCQKNGQRFLEKKGKIFSTYQDIKDYGLIIDGVFGTGFKGPVKEPYSSLIDTINRSKIPIIAIDIPSGLDGSTGQVIGSAVKATKTLFLGLPKTGFFLNEGWNFVGELEAVDFGLPSSIIEAVEADFDLLTHSQIAKLLPSIKRSRHKYQAGYVIGLAGSPGMPGAAILSSLSALRGGSGMVKFLHPIGMEAELAASPYELIKVAYEYDQHQIILEHLKKATATFIGPALGVKKETKKLLNAIMPQLEKPCVMDADALTIYAEEPFQLPKQVILTPHTGEMQRLLHFTEPLKIDDETLNKCQIYAESHKITLILKGAPTFIFHPSRSVQVNPTGDPGMATAGSGDVLTGFLASLLSQGLTCHEAAMVGVYLHGLAGEYAALDKTSYCLIASDLIDYFTEAFQSCL